MMMMEENVDRIICIVIDRECGEEMHKLLEQKDDFLPHVVDYQFLRVDSTHPKVQRSAKHIVSNYAPTKLPFILLVDPNKEAEDREYAAVYSEEGPITIDRIKAKL